MNTATLSLEDLMARTTPGPASCALWTGSVNAQGAPALYIGGKRKQARRLAYELSNEPVDPKKKVVHQATSTPADTVRLCINPDHTQVVDGTQQLKTHCPQGHPYAGRNLISRPGGGRACRTCRDQGDKDRWAEQKAQQAPRPPSRKPSPQSCDRLAALYAAHRGRIARLLVGEVRNADRHLAEDLTQETFIAAWLDLDQMRATTEPQTAAWLTTIARRIAGHHYRVKRNTCEFPADTGDWQMTNRDLVPSGGYYTPSRSGFRTATIGAAL
ncbi:RNA polymerase sigma factor [Streptomyces bacillaris]|uniref:RNA polymerase sigma factor n=1 Tax=Streptomyces bacillaris TaxID=68179 RepID=UPI0036374F85